MKSSTFASRPPKKRSSIAWSKGTVSQFPKPTSTARSKTRFGASCSELAGQGVDPNTLKLDWEKVKEAQREKALRNVRASLVLEKISEREGIAATNDEVDREVQRLARQEREAVPVTRARLEKDGTLARIAGHIQTEKTLQFLFDQASKQA